MNIKIFCFTIAVITSGSILKVSAQKTDTIPVILSDSASQAEIQKKESDKERNCCAVNNEGTPMLTVCFDFKTHKYLNGDEQKLLKLKLGDLYRVKIININTNLFKISIGKRDTVLNTVLTVPTFTNFGISDLSTLVTGLSAVTTASPPATAAQLDFSDTNVQGNLVAMFKDVPKFDKVLKNYAQRTGKTPPTDVEIVKAFQLTYANILKDYFKQLDVLKRNTDDLFNNYNRYIVQSQIAFQSAENNDFFNLTGMSLNDAYTKLNNIRSAINDLSDQLDRANNKYVTETDSYSALIQKTDDLKKSDDKLKSTYQQFATTLGKAKDAVSADNTLKFLSSLNVVMNNIQREYTSFPMQFTHDQNTLTLNVQPRKDDSGLEPYTTTFTFPLRQHNFWAVSTGVYCSTLYDKTYSTLETVETSGDTSYTVKSENPKHLEFGINAMIRYGWQIGNEKNDNYWQVGCGPGVNISDNIRGRLMLGTGFAHGKRHKLVVDIGAITGYTNELSVLYKENSTYTINPSSVTVSKLSFGAYTSVSYLFF